MPVAEAAADQKDQVSYELAFHVLPTVTEGEVVDVFNSIKAVVATHGGEVSVEEAPQRFELAYPVVKHTEGKNRSYKSAYFGWVRFSALPSNAPAILAEIEARADILRALLIKLTRGEEEHPFFFHEALVAKRVVTVDVTEGEEVTDEESDEAAEVAEDTEADAAEEVNEDEDTTKEV